MEIDNNSSGKSHGIVAPKLNLNILLREEISEERYDLLLKELKNKYTDFDDLFILSFKTTTTTCYFDKFGEYCEGYNYGESYEMYKYKITFKRVLGGFDDSNLFHVFN